jgi:putative ABC transport system substrate-binding protein
MRRREFIALLGSATATWVPVARAQQPAMPVVGFLSSRSADDSVRLVTSFRQGLKEAGYVDGQNALIEFRWAEGQYDRMSALAADLVRRQVAVIFASAPPGVAAAKAATTAIPVVFAVGGDPVKEGFVASLSRPGGNVTGAYVLATALEAKRLEFLHVLLPQANRIGYIVNSNFSESEYAVKEVAEAARTIGLQVLILKVAKAHDIETSFAALADQRADAALIAVDPFFNGRPAQFVALAAQYAIPAMFALREFAAAGGLLSYGANFEDGYHIAGNYVGRILKGEKAADLPVQESTKIELVINLKTAKTFGLNFPMTLLARADEVIE